MLIHELEFLSVVSVKVDLLAFTYLHLLLSTILGITVYMITTTLHGQPICSLMSPFIEAVIPISTVKM